MKKLFIVAPLIIFLMLVSSCSKTKDFSAVIAIDTKPQMLWIKEGGAFCREGFIEVIGPKGEKFKAFFTAEGSWLGSSNVIFRDSYPGCVGKVVYVKGYIDERGIATITEANVNQ